MKRKVIFLIGFGVAISVLDSVSQISLDLLFETEASFHVGLLDFVKQLLILVVLNFYFEEFVVNLLLRLIDTGLHAKEVSFAMSIVDDCICLLLLFLLSHLLDVASHPSKLRLLLLDGIRELQNVDEILQKDLVV